MNRFNKKLTLTLPEEDLGDHNDNYSPSPSIHDINNHDKDMYYHINDGGDYMDSESAQNRHQNTSKINFIEFQQFNAQQQPLTLNTNRQMNLQTQPQQMIKTKQNTVRNKRNFTIELPDRDDESAHKNKTSKQGMLLFQNNQLYDDKFKQPPAPSKGSKQGKMFIFPIQNTKKNYTKQAQNIQQIKQSFQRQRVQFYREKSKLEKEILVKNGQIQMLQKMVKQKYSPTNGSINAQQTTTKNNQFFRKNTTQTKIQKYQQIILEKDVEISQLLQRINYLNQCIDKKNQEINNKYMENCNMQKIIQSLRNQLYVYQKKQVNDKLTANFMNLKDKDLGQGKQSRKINHNQHYLGKEGNESRQYHRVMHVMDSCNVNSDGWSYQKDFGSKGLVNLQKRLQNLHRNRIDFDSRSHKIKSDISVQYPHSTRNISKGSFDFSGKALQRNNNNNNKLNRTRNY